MNIVLKAPRKEFYTYADEMLASDVSPLHWRKKAATMQTLKDAISAVLYGNEPPQRWHWATIVDALNLTQSFIEFGYIDDPDGLHADLKNRLAKAGALFLEKKVNQLRLDGLGAVALVEFQEGFEEMLSTLPARKVIKAYRNTDNYCRRILAGAGPGDGDFVQEL